MKERIKAAMFLSSFLLPFVYLVCFAAQTEFNDPTTGMEFVFVKGGCYQMGDVFGHGNVDEVPVHEVCIRDFYIGKHEVTREQWGKIMSGNPFFPKGGDRYPVENISWHEVQEFIGRLNRLSRRKYIEYRLPTEAEWEYAARSGGQKEKWAGTTRESELDEFAWTDQNSGEQTHPVGLKKPNGLGLFDMSGNVWEWVADWYDQDYYRDSPRNNPRGPDRSWDHTKVIRGGSWISMPGDSRASLRAKAIPSVRGNLGFRLVFCPP
jgi:formylglycine-generating enzyme required for sulfatase activity